MSTEYFNHAPSCTNCRHSDTRDAAIDGVPQKVHVCAKRNIRVSLTGFCRDYDMAAEPNVETQRMNVYSQVFGAYAKRKTSQQY